MFGLLYVYVHIILPWLHAKWPRSSANKLPIVKKKESVDDTEEDASPKLQRRRSVRFSTRAAGGDSSIDETPPSPSMQKLRSALADACDQMLPLATLDRVSPVQEDIASDEDDSDDLLEEVAQKDVKVNKIPN